MAKAQLGVAKLKSPDRFTRCSTNNSSTKPNNFFHVPHHVQQLRTLIAVRSRRDPARNRIRRFQPRKGSLLQNDLPRRPSLHRTALHRQRIIVVCTLRRPPRKLLNSCAVDQVMIELAVRSLTRVQPVVSLTETLDLCILRLAKKISPACLFPTEATSREHRPPFSILYMLLPVATPWGDCRLWHGRHILIRGTQIPRVRSRPNRHTILRDPHTSQTHSHSQDQQHRTFVHRGFPWDAPNLYSARKHKERTHYLVHSIDIEYGMTVLASVIHPRFFALAIELPSQRSSEGLCIDRRMISAGRASSIFIGYRHSRVGSSMAVTTMDVDQSDISRAVGEVFISPNHRMGARTSSTLVPR